MSARYGSLPGITNHYGATGLGVLGAVIRSTTSAGADGAGYMFGDLTAADDAAEIRGLITAWPSNGTLDAAETGVFTFTAPTGLYAFTYTLYVDGASVGTATVEVSIGGATYTQYPDVADVRAGVQYGASGEFTGTLAGGGGGGALTVVISGGVGVSSDGSLVVGTIH